LQIPLSLNDLKSYINEFTELFFDENKGCIPSYTTWGAYGIFFACQLVLAGIMPGMKMYGVVLSKDVIINGHIYKKGDRLPYLCNGYLCYYTCLFAFFLSHMMHLYFPK
jgi:hypothetical protein